jgi:mannose-1-phosphate guanylyltransferase
MIFAAGLGTRLRPLTDLLPKPVLPLFHRPLCARAIDVLRDAGATDVVLNTHHLAEHVARELEGEGRGVELVLSHEPRLLGTGGGVKSAVAAQSRALGRPIAGDEPFVAFNGDVLFAPDLERAIALHRSLGAIATMILREDPEAQRFGAIEIDAGARVRRLLGAPAYGGPLRTLMFTGVHVLSARAIADLPDEGCIVRHGYRRWLDRGEIVAGHVEGAAWRDLGTPREYLAANLELLAADPGRGIAPGAATGDGAQVRGSVIGVGAIVDPGVTLERCVVWPGTRASESASDAVLAGPYRVDARG